MTVYIVYFVLYFFAAWFVVGVAFGAWKDFQDWANPKNKEPK